jgi:IS30 family transposase
LLHTIAEKICLHPSSSSRELRSNASDQDICAKTEVRIKLSTKATWTSAISASQDIVADRLHHGTLWTLRLHRNRPRQCSRRYAPCEHRRLCGAAFMNVHLMSISAVMPAIGRTMRSVGGGWARLVTVRVCKDGLERVRQIPNDEAGTMMCAVLNALRPLLIRVRAMTRDNGTEFAEHAVTDSSLVATVYFAESHS